MQSIGQSLSLGVTAPLAIAGGLILKTAGDFEASMNRVQAALGASSGEMEQLSKLARDLGKSTTFSAGEAGDAIEMLAKNGVSASDILGGALKASLDLAASSGSDLASAADLATDIMLNFKKGVGDLGGVVDGVSGVLLASKFGFEDYRLALAQAGGVAGGLGVTLKDFNAVIAATSARFASGSDAGTAFKTFLQRLVPSSNQAADAMDKLGLEFFNADGSMKSMSAVAQELQDAFTGLSDEDKNSNLSTIFGTDAMRTAIGLMEAGAKGVQEMDAAISSAKASDQAAARTKGFNGALEQLGGAFDELKLAIANSGLLDTMTQLVQAFTGVIDKLSQTNPEVLKFSTIAAGIALVLGPVIFAIGTLVAVLGTVAIPVSAVIAGIAALGAALVTFWPQVVQAKDALIAFASDILAPFSGLAEKFTQFGRDMMDGLKAGLSEKFNSLKSWVQSWADALPQWMRDKLGIHSPSTVFAAIGANIMEGLGLGIGGGASAVQKQMEAVTNALAATGGRGSFGGAPKTVAELKSEAAARADVLTGLQREYELTGLTDSARRISDTLRRAHIDVLSAEGQQAVELMIKTEALKDEMERVDDVNRFAANSFSDLFTSAITGANSLKGAITSLASRLGEMAIQQGFMTLLGSGGFGSSLAGQTASNFFGIGQYANGTNFAPGGLALVGERGPELVNLPRGARVTPNGQWSSGGRSVVQIEMSGDMEGRILAQAADHSVQIVRKSQPGTVKQAVKSVGALRKQTKGYLA